MNTELTPSEPNNKPLEFEEVEPVDIVADSFKQGGYLSRPGYEPRTGQVEMAYEVQAVMAEGGNALVEAPTGVGKSYAYGVPASFFASKGERVVVVTGNIALQEQLIEKDIPTLEQAMPWPFTYALAKGLNNYLCLSNFEETTNDVVLDGIEGSVEEQKQWSEIVRWAGTTATGDLSELSFEPSPRVRPKFTTTSDDCPGRKCSNYDNCFAQRAKQRTKRAQLVVTNYALFFVDLTLKASGSPGVLPNYRHVVLDEGHKAPDAARGFMGFRTSLNAIFWAIKLLDAPAGTESKKGFLYPIDPELKKLTMASAEGFFRELLRTSQDKRYSVRFRSPWRGPLLDRSSDLCGLLAKCTSALNNTANDKTLSEVRRHELLTAGLRCASHLSNIGAATRQTSEGWVFFLEPEGKDRVALRGSPVHVGDYLRANLFEKKDKPAEIDWDDDGKPGAKEVHFVKSVTVTSATLATTLDNFEFISNELGVRDAVSLTVESPFEIAKNTLVVTPPMPSPQSPGFPKAVADKVVEAVERSKGRALCLFTSHKMLETVHEKAVRQIPYTVLRQGQAPRTKLIAKFREDISSVLFGTESFWTGVDVPGESCSMVVIDRIPFPNLSDPIQDFLKDTMGKRYFFEVSIPIALIALRQGVGRLIRTSSDRGVIVLLDSRIQDKPYGRKVLRIFPEGTSVTKDIDAVQDFLQVSEP